MAPTKDIKRKTQQYAKEKLLFKHCKKGLVDPSYMSLHNCERNCGIKYSDLTLKEMKSVVWGLRCGQEGYFISPEVESNEFFCNRKKRNFQYSKHDFSIDLDCGRCEDQG